MISKKTAGIDGYTSIRKVMSLSRFNLNSEPFRVFCICGGFGFPMGTASTKRIRLMGKCLISSGIPFHVWHIGPSFFPENRHKSGEFEGITYEYLSPSVFRPGNQWIRGLFYLWGCLQLIFRLFRHRREALIYLYSQGDLISLLSLWICRQLQIPAVQEACEWWPETIYTTCFKNWMYRHIMFRWSSGALSVSHLITDRIRSLARPEYAICRVPILVDPTENRTGFFHSVKDTASPPVLLWCGMVDGYKRDIDFLIHAMAELRSPAGRNCRLRIVGPCSEKCRTEILSYACSINISAERIDIVGFVSDTELWRHCILAHVLLMPLWDDDRSCTRFPSKLGQYVAAGRPIVTVRIGEVKHFLTDETAMFYPPGDVAGLSHCLDRLLTDPALGDLLAARATQQVLPLVDYRSNASHINQWFHQIHSGSRHV